MFLISLSLLFLNCSHYVRCVFLGWTRCGKVPLVFIIIAPTAPLNYTAHTEKKAIVQNNNNNVRFACRETNIQLTHVEYSPVENLMRRVL